MTIDSVTVEKLHKNTKQAVVNNLELVIVIAVLIFTLVSLAQIFFISSFCLTTIVIPYRYMKYLYDYECEKKNLSTRSELDAAIEGNKREGRRASGQYDAQAALAMVNI